MVRHLLTTQVSKLADERDEAAKATDVRVTAWTVLVTARIILIVAQALDSHEMVALPQVEHALSLYAHVTGPIFSQKNGLP